MCDNEQTNYNKSRSLVGMDNKNGFLVWRGAKQCGMEWIGEQNNFGVSDKIHILLRLLNDGRPPNSLGLMARKQCRTTGGWTDALTAIPRPPRVILLAN